MDEHILDAQFASLEAVALHAFGCRLCVRELLERDYPISLHREYATSARKQEDGMLVRLADVWPPLPAMAKQFWTSPKRSNAARRLS